jgi:dTDP-4-dehydrorhamnose reductase
MQVMITGAHGQLGRELIRSAPEGFRITAVDIEEIDIRNRSSVWATFEGNRPQLLINAAAYTAVDKAESDEAQAFLVNSQGAANLATAALEFGTRMWHLSTDFVFDGRSGSPYKPEDLTHPLSVYGRSKLEGENHVLEILGDRASVIRTSWLYSVFGANFVKTMLGLLKELPEIRVVCDQVGTPTWAASLARFIWAVSSRQDVPSILHWTDEGVASWYDFAVAIQEEALAVGLLETKIPIAPTVAADYPTPARRPPFSVLDKSKSREIVDGPGLHWREALRKMLRELPRAI